MAMKDIEILRSKGFQNVTNWGFGLKTNHLATLFVATRCIFLHHKYTQLWFGFFSSNEKLASPK
jgi:hypothetical protein